MKKRLRWNQEAREYLLATLKGHSQKEAYRLFCERYPVSFHTWKSARYKFIQDDTLLDIPFKAEPNKWVPIGTERKHTDGFWVVKTAEHEWRYKNIVMYERYHNVKLNRRVSVIHLNRNYDDFSEENLYMMTRGDTAILNRFYRFTSNDAEENLLKCKMAQCHHAMTMAKIKAKIGKYKYPSNMGPEITDPIKIEVGDCTK